VRSHTPHQGRKAGATIQHRCRDHSKTDLFNGIGHEGRFAQPSLSAGYEFRKETIAGRTGMSETRRKLSFPGPRFDAKGPRPCELSISRM